MAEKRHGNAVNVPSSVFYADAGSEREDDVFEYGVWTDMPHERLFTDQEIEALGDQLPQHPFNLHEGLAMGYASTYDGPLSGQELAELLEDLRLQEQSGRQDLDKDPYYDGDKSMSS